MKRNLEALFSQPFDIVVVGGGIYGATLIRELTAAGYRAALVEQGDFGAGTSANSMRVLHGGLRYLQHLDFPRVLESVYSRNYFLRFAPWLIDNVEFVIPLRGYGMKSPMAFRAALLIYAMITPHRNRGVAPDKHIPNGRILDENALRRIIPALDDAGIKGGGAWRESVVSHAERLILELIKSADDNGAVCQNHTVAEELIHSGPQVTGLLCSDKISGKSRIIQSRCVIDCSNRHIGELGQALPDYNPRRQHWARAVNFIIRRPLYGKHAVGLGYRDHVRDSKSKLSGDQRMLFFTPWKGQTMVGTFYDHEQTLESGLVISAAERRQFLDIVNRVYTGDPIGMDEISRWHSGWMPLQDLSGDVDLAKDHHVRWVGSGLIELTGVKFTTAPAVARGLIKQLQTHLPPSLLPQPTSPAHEPDHWADAEPPDTVLTHAVEEEMACHLSDLLLRRTGLAEAGKPDNDTLKTCAKLMGKHLNWDKDRIDEEIEYIHALFRQQGME